MDTLYSLFQGFFGLLSVENMLAVLIGTTLGTVVGVLPGLGPAATMAVLLPITLGMGPAAGLIMLAGIFFGAQYGGSTTSILLRIPGEATSVITCIDGYEMSRKGRAGAALTASAVGSFIAATMGFIGLSLFAMPLARFALKFGPPEYFVIGIAGLFVLTNVTGGSFFKNILMVLVGIMLATVGMDPISALVRFDFGFYVLGSGIGYIPVLIGLFGMAEIFDWALNREDIPKKLPPIRFRDLYPNREEWRRMFPPIFRGGIIGFFTGLLPGPGAITATYASYAFEKKIAKHPEEFGQGAIEGVAGPESANNAGAVGQMVPLLSLGLPFSALTAIMLGAIQMQGITPGPLFIVQNPEIFWVLMASFFIGNAVLLCFNLPLVGVLAMVLRIPMWLLMSIVTLICVIGTYSINNQMIDTWIMLIFGVVGYLMRSFDYQAPPLVLGMVFGPLIERTFIQSMLLFHGNLFGFFGRPVSGTFLYIVLVGYIIFLVLKFGKRKKSFSKR